MFELVRELIEVRHASALRDIFNQLTNRDLRLINPDGLIYFRDIYDHLIRLTDELDKYRELAAATLDIYLSQVNNSLSDIMKPLTGVTVILARRGRGRHLRNERGGYRARRQERPVASGTVTAVVVGLRPRQPPSVLRRIDSV